MVFSDIGNRRGETDEVYTYDEPVDVVCRCRRDELDLFPVIWSVLLDSLFRCFHRRQLVGPPIITGTIYPISN
jgi:hypothetical protein